VLTIWKDWLTADALVALKLSDRQKSAVLRAKAGERLTNTGYQQQFGVSKPTATRDLDELSAKGVLVRVGITGKGTYYELKRKGLTKGSKGSPSYQGRKGS